MIGLMSTASWYSLHLSLEVNVAAKYSDHVILSAGVQKGWSVSFFLYPETTFHMLCLVLLRWVGPETSPLLGKIIKQPIERIYMYLRVFGAKSRHKTWNTA